MGLPHSRLCYMPVIICVKCGSLIILGRNKADVSDSEYSVRAHVQAACGDRRTPAVLWELDADETNVYQGAYRITVELRKTAPLSGTAERRRAEIRRTFYITAHGIYEAKKNGKPVTDAVLNPGFTTYDKRLRYQVFPVETLLQRGENAIAVTVADGWYKGKIALGRGCEYGEVPGLLLQLETEYADGTRTVLCSDESWQYSFDRPVRAADLFLTGTRPGIGRTVVAACESVRRDSGAAGMDRSKRGYAMVSPTEGEIVAKKFFEAGYQAFVLTYMTNMFQIAPLKKQPLKDISRAVRHIRTHAEELHVKSEAVACCGFSAGAHLVGSLAVHYEDDALKEEPCQEVSNRPDAVLLCYPVITSGEKAHRESFELLFGKDAPEEDLAWASLEHHVTADTPPVFLWHTLTDELVPVDNSILFAQACRRAGVPCELHLFMEGCHGMSLANEDWASNNIEEGSLYTMGRQWQTMKTLYGQNPAAIPETFASAAQTETLADFVKEWSTATDAYRRQKEQHADKSIAQWPALAIAWREKIE